jgi:hypothetical protein
VAERIRIRRLVALAVLGWAGTFWMILSTAPDALDINPPLFFFCLAIALFGSFSLGAFALSFVLFHSASQRGSLAYSNEQGLLLTALTITLILLSMARAISAVSLLILLAVFLLWQVILLVRVTNVKS